MSAVSGAASTAFSVVCVSVVRGSANIPGVSQTVQCIPDCIIDVWRERVVWRESNLVPI